MTEKLTELATGKLCEKFGAGDHKPGSGSAAALQGMVAAQLLRTVIDLTNHPKRQGTYVEHLPELLTIKEQIDIRIYPALEGLFQTDSEQFDVTIKLREQRDQEKDWEKKKKLKREALNALVPSTEIPLKIAGFCIELANFATFVFDNGFKSARGDSYVAFNNAVSCVGSCLAIAELNISSFPPGEWVNEINRQKSTIKKEWNQLAAQSLMKMAVLEKQSADNISFHTDVAVFKRGNLSNEVSTNADIEAIARSLQNNLWIHRTFIWKKDVPKNTIDILKPEIALRKILEYNYAESNNLGIHEVDGEFFEIAGVIDKTKQLVQISKNFSKESRNFTIAHELGHAILHDQMVLHRDRSIDGSSKSPRSKQEMQADKFAAYFLMPANQVEDYFAAMFGMHNFMINDGTALGLRSTSAGALRYAAKDLRGLSRIIASADYFAGKSFKSLAEIFGVSIETMAIRLEELNLVKF